MNKKTLNRINSLIIKWEKDYRQWGKYAEVNASYAKEFIKDLRSIKDRLEAENE